MPSKLIENTMRVNRLPHIWCPGCGHGILMRDVAQAIENCGLDPDKVVIVSGIGCSSRAAGYMNYNTLHTTHGRAIAFATGVKLANPDLHVIVITGDGDATAIGGNHLIHAARRNIDLTVIVFNNSIYGMTGGQYSPTTPHMEKGTTAPYGNIDYVFDIPKLAEAAGATFTGRCSAYHAQQAIKLIEAGIKHHGFSVIDGVSVCPTYYGRKNKKGDSVKMLNWQKDNFVDVKVAEKLPPEKLEGKTLIGKFYESNDKAEYTDMYMNLIERAGGKK
ncbi:MAG: 2-oxoacid:ferredoxin oxidoreductase subunit beta [Firmicutes bacterium]|nr:2-oxoacid:ferredoxin oxidoreductase subunit beta [Bacillota bacterium]MBQ1734079.1 2-oxoacid:ferredoxin oxidoreductase subunit beta [Lachnospiraceae bacterium]MBQ1825569.1 2-oxoacid:ferredoxin oxidoreductase subunit beta [Bacillota bacterium]MEE3382555.1 2-oxoacid:ferredoxin oxidoreductase subunit beta [Anaerovoracaceae bacterium]